MPWHHNIKLSFWSFRIFIFLSFSPDINLIKCLKCLKSQSQILNWQSLTIHRPRVGTELLGQLNISFGKITYGFRYQVWIQRYQDANEKREIASEEISSPSRFTVFWFQMQMKICIQEISLLSPFYIYWLQDLEIIWNSFYCTSVLYPMSC